jgi:hypothetical protein
MPSDDALAERFGPHAVISRSGVFVLVHLDNPSPALVAARTDSFDPDEFFEPDCALCAIARARRIVVFEDADDQPHDEEEILIE